MTSLSELGSAKPRLENDMALNARSRLMLPRVEQGESLAAKLLVTKQSEARQSPAKAEAEPAEPADPGMTDLLIRGLVERLPTPNATWPFDERIKWLCTAASIFDLIYQPGEADKQDLGAPSKPDIAPEA
jgi:hypothetical protein